MSSAGQLQLHDRRMISILEIIGSYFVDIIFNHVYTSARTNQSGGSSLTDEYIRFATAYMTGVKSDKKCYGDTVRGLHKYLAGTTSYTTISFSAFVDLIVKNYIPEEYFREFTSPDKDEILSSILCDLVSNLISGATEHSMLRRIIDEHDQAPAVTIRMLQDIAIQSLLAKRSELLNKFLRKKGQAREHVPMDVVEPMKRALRQLVKEKAEIASQLREAEEANAAIRSQLREAKTREAKLRQLVDLLRDGQKRGAASAGASLSVPPRDRIAEDPFDISKETPYVPPQDRIAEKSRAEPPPWADAFSSKKESVAPPKKKGPALPADFFQSSVTVTDARTPAPVVEVATATAAAAQPLQAAPPTLHPTGVFDDETVDFEDDGSLLFG